MALKHSTNKVSSIVIRYVERKKNDSLQYRRRIPSAVSAHYSGKKFYVKSLQRYKNCLVEKTLQITEQLDREWKSLGWTPFEQEALVNQRTSASTNILLENITHEQKLSELARNSSLCLDDAKKLYLEFHEKGDNKKFKADCERIIQQIIERCGNLPINIYTRQHAEEFRDFLLRKNSTATVRRSLNTATAVFNKAKREKQLAFINPFEGLGIPKESADAIARIPFTSNELRIASDACRNLDDDIRHIVAFQIDTGCRVAEVVGLRVDDVILDGPVPYVRIRPYGKVRTLKTAASERDIPLVGEALWAAGRAVEACRKAADASSWLFPRYASDKEIKATHASATLNKWLRSLKGVSDQKTTHCFRHAMRDRLRAAQVPVEIQDCLGGWGSRSIGQGYGNGYPLNVLAEHLTRALDPVKISEATQ